MPAARSSGARASPSADSVPSASRPRGFCSRPTLARIVLLDEPRDATVTPSRYRRHERARRGAPGKPRLRSVVDALNAPRFSSRASRVSPVVRAAGPNDAHWTGDETDVRDGVRDCSGEGAVQTSIDRSRRARERVARRHPHAGRRRPHHRVRRPRKRRHARARRRAGLFAFARAAGVRARQGEDEDEDDSSDRARRRRAPPTRTRTLAF